VETYFSLLCARIGLTFPLDYCHYYEMICPQWGQSESLRNRSGIGATNNGPPSAQETGKRSTSATTSGGTESTSVYVSKLPTDITEEELGEDALLNTFRIVKNLLQLQRTSNA
jgi:hypothetical protein